jgi:ADP-dependent NAD(P)H-hydrate dehydratase / NAD(P)H-hydrate epimerase
MPTNYREQMTDFVAWTPADAARHISVPVESSDKYSRGVLGIITGSDRYPGAAVLGVDAALHTGVGMVRYLGGERASTFVLQRRPEAVTADGRVQAWLIGSGTDSVDKEADAEKATDVALGQALPTVLDGGALERVHDSSGPTIVTPHFGELARLLDVDKVRIAEDPARWALTASDELDVTVLLKGHNTFVAGGGVALVASSAPVWTATAGAGDALAGILGALVATHRGFDAEGSLLARLGATASVLHGLAAQRASNGGPFPVLDLVGALPATVADLLR